MEKKNKSIKRELKFWAGVWFAQILLFYIFSKLSPAVRLFESFYEWKKDFFGFVFSKLGFSAGDVLYFLLGLGLLFSLVKIFQKKSRKKYTLKLLISWNVFYFVYQCFWGMLYFQHPIISKLSEKPPAEEEIKSLAVKYLNRCLYSRNRVKEDANGVFMIESIREIEQEILSQQKHLPAYISSKKSVEISSFKPSLYSGMMSATGISGYYNPFTTEPQYNAAEPSTYIPFTLSHESAHQLGFAREQEANFIGYLIGRDSSNWELKYSTEYFVLKSLLHHLAERDEAFVKNILSRYSEGMQRDRQHEKDFITQNQGLLNDFFSTANDLFLKSNQQEGSVTYSYFIDLLVRYERG